MLKMLSGKTHQVITGVALVWKEKNISEVWSEVSEVRFKTLSDELIAQYTAMVNTLDKAGAYAIQEHGDLIIESFQGDLDNVIGLPVASLLQKLGV